MTEHYDIKLDSDYVLGLFRAEVEKNTDCTKLAHWSDVIMEWYEDQLENDELDWGFSIPELVKDDIVFHKMIVVTPDDPHYDEIEKLYEEEGCYCVDEFTDYVARICYCGSDKDGRAVYLCQQEL